MYLYMHPSIDNVQKQSLIRKKNLFKLINTQLLCLIPTHLTVVLPLRLLQLVPQLLRLRRQPRVEQPELLALLLRLLQLRLQLGLELPGSLLEGMKIGFSGI